MRISILTSSRADYGIYLPLLKCLKEDSFFDTNIIAFGTHLSQSHGYTIDHIINDGFDVDYKVETVLGDAPNEISKSMSVTIDRFAEIWNKEKDKTDLIVCLGDRYEMFAAVTASIPFNLPVAHLCGGDTTLGAIDNIFRHSITLMSSYHLATTVSSCNRIKSIIGSDSNIYNVGSLSLDNLDSVELLSLDEFMDKFKIDLSIPTVLVTFHPETISYNRNEEFANILFEVFRDLVDFQIVITMPNADTMGAIIRNRFTELADSYNHVVAVENFGVQGYFTIMKHSKFLVGNTSSGIVEAASFKKYVLNLGDRQKGRVAGENVINSKIEKQAIIEGVRKVSDLGEYEGENIYKGEQKASAQIIEILKNIK